MPVGETRVTRDGSAGKHRRPAADQARNIARGFPMRTARLAVTVDAFGVLPRAERGTGRSAGHCASGTSHCRARLANRAATVVLPSNAVPVIVRTAEPPTPPFRVAAHAAVRHVARGLGGRGTVLDAERAEKAARTRGPTRERPGQRFEARQGRQGRRVRERILGEPVARSDFGPHSGPARHLRRTSHSVSPARRGAISQRTEFGCNTSATGTITFPIAIREVSITRCKTVLFDAEWLARILFAGRGYLERGR